MTDPSFRSGGKVVWPLALTVSASARAVTTQLMKRVFMSILMFNRAKNSICRAKSRNWLKYKYLQILGRKRKV
jgi:hypothetical protein